MREVHDLDLQYSCPTLANTVYAVDIGMTSSTSGWKTGIPYIQISGNELPEANVTQAVIMA